MGLQHYRDWSFSVFSNVILTKTHRRELRLYFVNESKRQDSSTI